MYINNFAAFEIVFLTYFFQFQRRPIFCRKPSPLPFVRFHTPLDASSTNPPIDGAAAERLQMFGELSSETLSTVSYGAHEDLSQPHVLKRFLHVASTREVLVFII